MSCPVKKIEGGEVIGLVAETPTTEVVKEEATPKKRTTKKTTEK